MEFWRVEKLKRSLSKSPLSQKDSFKYLLYFFFFWAIEVALRSPGGEYVNITFPLFFSKAFYIVTFLVEIIMSYRINGGKNGNDFLARYCSIKLLTTIRMFIFYALVFLPIFVYFGWDNLDAEDIITAIFQKHPNFEKFEAFAGLIFFRIFQPLRIILNIRDIKRIEDNHVKE